MIYAFLALAAVAGTAVTAWKWGGLDEKLAASGFVLATLASNIANTSQYQHTEIGVAFIDVALFVGLLVLADRKSVV